MDTSNIEPPSKLPTIEYIQNQHIQLMRNQRNQLLEKTDKYILSDFPLTVDKKDEVKAYRQALRDYFMRDDVVNWVFTFENQYPPDFPTAPSFL